MSHWHRHPGVKTGDDLTLGQRAADKVRNGMGSWPFVFLFLGAMAMWACINTFLHVGGDSGFDPYPYILLNLMLSTMAGLQGAILLIAAKRADQVSSEVALHDLQQDQRAVEILEDQNKALAQMYAWAQAIHAHIDPDGTTPLNPPEYLEPTTT